MNRLKLPSLPQFYKLRRQLVMIFAVWGRHQALAIIASIVVLWCSATLLLHLAEIESGSAYGSWGGALWNVWHIIFGGTRDTPASIAGRVISGITRAAGVALAGLFTASVASILIERVLKRRQMTNLEMSNHLVLCNWSPRGMQWIREVHSNIVADKRPIVIIHDNTDEIELPDKQEDPAFHDIYIVKGDPANEIILRRAKVAQAHSVVILSDDRQGVHADGKSIVCCIAVKNTCRGDVQPNLVVECQDPKHYHHMRKAGADEVISAADFGLRLMARASLFHGVTRVYQELLTVGRDANEMYVVPAPAQIIGRTFVEVANAFMAKRQSKNACLLLGIYRGEKMMLNPVGSEAGPLQEKDELILMCPQMPDLSSYAWG